MLFRLVGGCKLLAKKGNVGVLLIIGLFLLLLFTGGQLKIFSSPSGYDDVVLDVEVEYDVLRSTLLFDFNERVLADRNLLSKGNIFYFLDGELVREQTFMLQGHDYNPKWHEKYVQDFDVSGLVGTHEFKVEVLATSFNLDNVNTHYLQNCDWADQKTGYRAKDFEYEYWTMVQECLPSAYDTKWADDCFESLPMSTLLPTDYLQGKDYVMCGIKPNFVVTETFILDGVSDVEPVLTGDDTLDVPPLPELSLWDRFKLWIGGWF